VRLPELRERRNLRVHNSLLIVVLHEELRVSLLNHDHYSLSLPARESHFSDVFNIEQTDAFIRLYAVVRKGYVRVSLYAWVHQVVEVPMTCLSCQSVKQVELTAEMLIHFPRLKRLDKPGVFLFPRLMVCMDCGFSRFTVAKTELESIAKDTLTHESSTMEQNVGDDAINSQIML